MAANAVITLAQSADSKSQTYQDKNFRHGDQGSANVDVISFNIAANSGTATAAALSTKLMQLPEGSKVKEVTFICDVVPAGASAAGSARIGYQSTNTDLLASNDDHYMATKDLTGVTVALPYTQAPEAPPSTPSDATWHTEQRFPVPVDIELTFDAGYKSTAAITGKVRIVWES